MVHRYGLSLHWQIGLLLLPGVLTLFGVFVLLGTSMARESSRQMADERLHLTGLAAWLVDEELEEEFEFLELDAAQAVDLLDDPSTRNRFSPALMSSVQPFVAGIYVVDRDGRLVWAEPATRSRRREPRRSGLRDGNLLRSEPASLGEFGTDLSAQPYVREPLTTGTRYASGIHVDPAGRPVVVLSVPVVRPDGAHLGVVAASLDLDDDLFQVLVHTAQQLGESGHAELVDQHVRLIASTAPDRILGSAQHPRFYRPLLEGRVSSVGLTDSSQDDDPAERGDRHVMAFVPLTAVPWGLGLGDSESTFMALAARWQRQASALGVLALGTVVFLVWATRQTVVAPVRALIGTSQRIARGDLTTPVPPVGGAEVRVLAESLERMRDRLQEARDAERKLDRLKEEFLSTVSHELRTPIGHIKGYATTLLLEPEGSAIDPALVRRCLRVIVEASEELQELVDNLLDVSRIAAGALAIDPHRIRLRPLARAAVERARSRARGHVLRLEVPRALPPVHADPRRLEQVLDNLLDNALKYAPDGGDIAVAAEAAGGEVVISVRDDGPGIPSDELGAIFDRFQRGKRARSWGIAGTGLGLAICRGIVQAHGGRIWAESPARVPAPDRRPGTVVRFTLPIAARIRPVAARRVSAPKPGTGGST